MTIAELLLYHDMDMKAEKSSREENWMEQHVRVHVKAVITASESDRKDNSDID